jgi:DNA-binding transcriptional LysR family regulator
MMSFVKVVENSGFSAAARRLNVSTSIVTGHIQSLENRLGVRLLNRSTRKISLTEVGQAYYERCVQILSEMDEADQIAEALQSKPRGTLQLNVAPPIPALIAPSIAKYGELYPDASVRLVVTSRLVDLVEEGYDLAIRITQIPESNLIVRRLANYRFVVCGAPSYFAKHGQPGSPADLVHHNCLMYDDSPWHKEWPFTDSQGNDAGRLSGNLQSNSSDSLRLAALLGQGLVYVPNFLVADELRSGDLVPTLTNFAPVEMTINAVYPHRRHLSAKVRSFIDLVAQQFRDAKWGEPAQA